MPELQPKANQDSKKKEDKGKGKGKRKEERKGVNGRTYSVKWP
jgi:hypothetical protein